MYYKSKKISFLILLVTALVCARTMFLFFNDPEGPNLLIVSVAGAIIYGWSLLTYVCSPTVDRVFHRLSLSPLSGLGRLLLAISVQILLVAVLAVAFR